MVFSVVALTNCSVEIMGSFSSLRAEALKPQSGIDEWRP